MKSFLIGIISVTLLVTSCKRESDITNQTDHVEETRADILTNSGSQLNANINNERYAWQKPSLVINKLGDLNDKVVADIGAGTGYFTFRLMQNAKKVIAVDIDPNMINLIELFRQNLDSLYREKIETRLATPNDSKLRFEEVDVAVIINTIGYIEERLAYLEQLQEKIKPGGEIMIVDFKMKRIPDNIAPPAQYRLSLLELEDLLAQSGYDMIESDDLSLDYQYIVKAVKR